MSVEINIRPQQTSKPDRCNTLGETSSSCLSRVCSLIKKRLDVLRSLSQRKLQLFDPQFLWNLCWEIMIIKSEFLEYSTSLSSCVQCLAALAQITAKASKNVSSNSFSMKHIRRFSLEMYFVCYFLQLLVKRLINSIWQPVRGWSCPFRTSYEFSQTNQHRGQLHTGCQSTHRTRNTRVPHHCIPVITGHRRLDLLQKTQFRRSQWHNVVLKENPPFFPLMNIFFHGYFPGLDAFKFCCMLWPFCTPWYRAFPRAHYLLQLESHFWGNYSF